MELVRQPKEWKCGCFPGIRGDDLLVFFEDVGVVKISRQTWIKRNLTGQKWEVSLSFALF